MPTPGSEPKFTDLQRPHIVFNRVLTILKAVAGMEINGRHEIQFIPSHNEVTAPNELLSAASKWMADGCDGEDEESEAFDNCATCGMGWTENGMSYDDDPSGLYREESINPLEMYWDHSVRKKNVAIIEGYEPGGPGYWREKAAVAEMFSEGEARILVDYLQRTDPEGAPIMEPVKLPVPGWLLSTEECIGAGNAGFSFPLSERDDYGLPFRVDGYCRLTGRLLMKKAGGLSCTWTKCQSVRPLQTAARPRPG